MALRQVKYNIINKRLQEIGYNYSISDESEPVVKQLVLDLMNVENELQKYKRLAALSRPECEKWRITTDSYAEKNKQLIKENNQLYHKLMITKEECSRAIRELEMKVGELQHKNALLDFLISEKSFVIGEQQQQLLKKDKRLAELLNGSNPKHAFVRNESKVKRDNYLVSTVDPGDYNPKSDKTAHQTNKDFETMMLEIATLKLEKDKLIEDLNFKQEQVFHREMEIMRLYFVLETKKHLAISLKKNCICHSDDSNVMEEKIKDAQTKQCTTVHKAADLGDRIVELEQRLLYNQDDYAALKKGSVETFDIKYQNQVVARNNKFTQIDEDMFVHERDALKIYIKQLEKEKNLLQQQNGYLEFEKNSGINKEKLEVEVLKKESQSLKSQLTVAQAELNEFRNKAVGSEKNSEINRENLEVQVLKKESETLKSQLIEANTELIALRSKVADFEKNSINKKEKTELEQLMKETELLRSQLSTVQEELTTFRNLAAKENEKGLRNEHTGISPNSELEELKKCNADLKSKLLVLKSEMRALIQQSEKYKEDNSYLNSEKSQLGSAYDHLKSLCDHSERSQKGLLASFQMIEAELSAALIKIQELEVEKNVMENHIMCFQSERKSLHTNISHLENEKDSFLMRLDEKTEELSQAKKEIRDKVHKLSELEHTVTKLQDEILNLKEINDQNLFYDKCATKQFEDMKREISKLENFNQSLKSENRKLQEELASCLKREMQVKRCVDTYKEEVCSLKTQLQGYVMEVKRVEDLLLEKETQRAEMLNQFKNLSLEASSLNMNNNTLEKEAKCAEVSLRAVQEKIRGLEAELEDKDTLISSLETQVSVSTQQIASLEMKVIDLETSKERLRGELLNFQMLCTTIEDQKKQLLQQNLNLITSLKKLEEEIMVLKSGQEQSECKKNEMTSSESLFPPRRQETIHLNKQLETLQHTVKYLENQLRENSSLLRKFQLECEGHEQEISELRRSIANERSTKEEHEEDS